eukprot:Clim_evm6s175 gene=Clim_evmTU6s175
MGLLINGYWLRLTRTQASWLRPAGVISTICRYSTSDTAAHTTGPEAVLSPSQLYEQRVEEGLLLPDDQQRSVLPVLDTLHGKLLSGSQSAGGTSHRKTRGNSIGGLWGRVSAMLGNDSNGSSGSLAAGAQAPRGLYLWGGVGIGKTMLMNTLYESLEGTSCRARRIHFHDFMAEVHKEAHQWRQTNSSGGDPLPAIASGIAGDVDLLCFDEFQVSNIADAMLLLRLFRYFTGEADGNGGDRGPREVTVIATSNRSPNDLYEGGLNRSLFLPFIPLLERHSNIIHLPRHIDYRRKATPVRDGLVHWVVSGKADAVCVDADMIAQLTGKSPVKNTRIGLPASRSLLVGNQAGGVALFDFKEVCESNLGAADYASIASHFHTILIKGVPTLTAIKMNEARRFITFIDVCYESNARLICEAEQDIEHLFQLEMQTSQPGTVTSMRDFDDLHVVGEGGSSSSHMTTMVGDMEWSGTGRKDASLGSASGNIDTRFASDRTVSRLMEMQSEIYHRRWKKKHKIVEE